MIEPAPFRRPIVVCPLQFERKMLERAGLALRCDLVCCGYGAARIAVWASGLGQPGRPVFLAGLAGGLSPAAHAGQAGVIREVVDAQTGQRWRSEFALQPPAARVAQWSVTSNPTSVLTHAAKSHLARQTSADLVDLESVAFAQAACAANWSWAIVRGVSDDLQSSLPPNIDQWVDHAGRPRVGVVLRALLFRPQLIPVVWKLQRCSSAAMQSVANVLTILLNH